MYCFVSVSVAVLVFFHYGVGASWASSQWQALPLALLALAPLGQGPRACDNSRVQIPKQFFDGRFILDRHTYIHTHLSIYICIYYIYGFVTMFSWNFPWSSAAGQLKHRYNKSFQNIVFHSVFTTVSHMFFAKKLFNALSDIQKHFNVSLFTMFFQCWLFFHCREPAKMIPNSIKELSKMSQNHPKFHFYAFSSSDSIGKLRSRCETVFATPS